jgi:hypothetical protein
MSLSLDHLVILVKDLEQTIADFDSLVLGNDAFVLRMQDADGQVDLERFAAGVFYFHPLSVRSWHGFRIAGASDGDIHPGFDQRGCIFRRANQGRRVERLILCSDIFTKSYLSFNGHSHWSACLVQPEPRSVRDHQHNCDRQRDDARQRRNHQRRSGDRRTHATTRTEHKPEKSARNGTQ